MPSVPLGMALAPLDPPGSAGRPVVMVVDDEMHILDSLRSILELLLPGTPAVFYADPVDAVEGFDAKRVGLLVTDFKMHHMNGVELIEALRRKKPGLAAFVITAYNDPQVIGLRADAVQAPVLNKPFGAEDFVKLVKRLLPAAV